MPELTDRQQNHQQDKKILAVFTHTFGVTKGNVCASEDTKVQSTGHWGFFLCKNLHKFIELIQTNDLFWPEFHR